MMKPRWYWLNPDKSISPAPSLDDNIAFAKYTDWLYEGTNRFVKRTQLRDGAYVSTVFLGLDHSYHPDAKPIVFESMVFDEEGKGGDMCRYDTWRNAIIGHAEMVKKHGGEFVPEPPTEAGAREYEEIMAMQMKVK